MRPAGLIGPGIVHRHDDVAPAGRSRQEQAGAAGAGRGSGSGVSRRPRVNPGATAPECPGNNDSFETTGGPDFVVGFCGLLSFFGVKVPTHSLGGRNKGTHTQAKAEQSRRKPLAAGDPVLAAPKNKVEAHSK